MSTEEFVIYDFDPRNLPPEFLRAIGLVVAASAQTEWIMQKFVGALLAIDSAETTAIAAHMSAPLKDQIARTLIELNGTSADIIDEVDDLLDAIKNASDRRNVLVHNAFARHPKTGEIYSFRESARGSLQVSLQPVAVQQIEQDAALIYDAGIKLEEFMGKFHLHPLERTRPIHQPLKRGKKAREARGNHRSTPAE